MKTSEILQSSMVNDNTRIYISKPIGDTGLNSRFVGSWYQDGIMDFSECEITKLVYDRDNNAISMEVE